MIFEVFYRVGMKIKQTVLLTIIAIPFLSGILNYNIAAAATCSGHDTAIIKCDQSGGTELKDNGVWALLLLAVNILTAGVAIVAVGGIVYGSILYTSSSGNPDQVKKAINIIVNVVIGIVAYALAYSFLNFVIPGGMFTS